MERAIKKPKIWEWIAVFSYFIEIF